MSSKRTTILLSNFEHAVPDSVSHESIVRATRENKLGDGFCCWLDHMYGNLELPEPVEGEKYIVTFWPNNPYNERRAAQQKVEVEEYVEWAFDNILKLRDERGDDFIWCVGWEIFNAHGWCEKDGSPLVLNNRSEGFEFYKKWVATSLHTKHWRGSVKFGDAKNNTRPSALEFIAEKGFHPEDFNLALGCQTAHHAHYAFEAFPWLRAFWFEGGITSVNTQVGNCYARGAARQYDRKWIADISPYSYPYPIHKGNQYEDLGEWGKTEGGLKNKCRLNFPKYDKKMSRLAGYSDSALSRSWLTAIMQGADYLFQEASCLSHFVDDNVELRLTPHGEAARKLALFNSVLPCDYKVSSPVKLLLDFDHGIEPNIQETPWARCAPEFGDAQILEFFNTAYPGHSEFPRPFPWKTQEEYGRMLMERFDFRPYERKLTCDGRWSDIFDVFLNRNLDAKLFSENDTLLLLGGGNPVLENEEVLWTLAEKGVNLFYSVEQVQRESKLLPENIVPGQLTTSSTANNAESKSIAEFADFQLTAMQGKIDANWTVLYMDDRGNPIIVRRKVGKGSLNLCLAPYALNNQHRLLNSFVDLLSNHFVKSVPFSLEGEMIQSIIGESAEGHILTLINNHENEWNGKVTINVPYPAEITEIWQTENDESIPHETAGTTFETKIPGFEAKVFKIRKEVKDDK